MRDAEHNQREDKTGRTAERSIKRAADQKAMPIQICMRLSVSPAMRRATIGPTAVPIRAPRTARRCPSPRFCRRERSLSKNG